MYIHVSSKISTLLKKIHIFKKYPVFQNIEKFIYFPLGVVKAGLEQIATNVLSAKDVSTVHATNHSNATATNSGVEMIAK